MRENGLYILMAVAALFAFLFLTRQKRTSPAPEPAPSSAPPAATADALRRSAERAHVLQQEYWSPSPEEKRGLLSRGVDALSWSEKLRLLHLTCAEELSTEAWRSILDGDDFDESDMPAGPNRDLVQTLVADLRSPSSPFRPQHVAVWTGQAGESDTREPNAQGRFENASLTHLGALEVVRLDADHQATELAFVPLDDLRGVIMASRAMFRLAKLLYDDGRPDELVLLPMIYGISWSVSQPMLHDGSMTIFSASIHLRGEEQVRSIGLGHQDFVVSGAGASLIGLGSIGELVVVLSADHPRFEEKCRARGIDPEEVRKRAAAKK